MRPLFGNLSDSSSSKNLVEFRAGKMYLKGTTVTADKRKGFLYLHQSDDSLMHFCWKDRTTGIVEDDLIIFPDDVEYKKVPQCTTGRAFVLRFKLSKRKFFFWMQEPKDDKDEEYCKKINDFLNNPPAPGSKSTPGLPHGLSSLGDQLGDAGLQSMLSGMDQNQIIQLLSETGLAESSSRPTSVASNTGATRSETQASPAVTAPPSTSATKTTSSTKTSNSAAKSTTAPAVQLTDLQNILASMNTPQNPQEPVDLSTAINTESLAPLLADPEVRQRLSEFLPEVGDLTNSENEVKETIQSPQFKQALSTFSAALQSGQLAPLIQQFNLGEEAATAAAKGDIIAFVTALQKSEGSKISQPMEDDDMGLD